MCLSGCTEVKTGWCDRAADSRGVVGGDSTRRGLHKKRHALVCDDRKFLGAYIWEGSNTAHDRGTMEQVDQFATFDGEGGVSSSVKNKGFSFGLDISKL